MTPALRIGTTSFILPDHILPNVEFLRQKVADVELLLFESGAQADLPDAATIGRLAEIGRESDLSYTVHLPLDVDCAGEYPEERSQAVAACRRTIGLTAPLSPWAYVLHLPQSGVATEEWRARAVTSVRDILADNVPPRTLCIENIDYPFADIAPVVEELDLGVCLDTGHLMLHEGGDPLGFLERWRERLRVVHLHGVEDGKDHRSLASLDRDSLRMFMAELALDGVPRVVTIEVFGLDRFRESLAILEDVL